MNEHEMPPQPRRVFLSHTSDLAAFPPDHSYVQAAIDAVSLAGDAVSDMAFFTAREHQPAAFCCERVRESDVYIGLIGFRYGTPVPERPELSFTELEYESAAEASLDRFVFL